MARKVFISFRFSDGAKYKNELTQLFDSSTQVIDCSENQDRSSQSESTIKNYLYGKLKNTSVTIVIITPKAVEHQKNWRGEYDDWMYDEIRYSLEDRENNRCNGLIAVYTPEAKNLLISSTANNLTTLRDVDNLFRKNMMNILPSYKKNPKEGVYDGTWDSYCSLVSWDDFKKNYADYIDKAEVKRENTYKYNIKKRL